MKRILEGILAIIIAILSCIILLISFFDMDSTQVYYRLMNYPDFYLSG